MATTPLRRLRVEIALYEVHKSEWLQIHRDKFVVIRGTSVLGFFVTFHSAYCTAVEEYGMDVDFLVKRVVPQESPFVMF